MNNSRSEPAGVYLIIRFWSALLFSVIVTVNLVYQATVAGLSPLQMVLAGTVLEINTFLFEVPTGIVADVYSRKLSVMIGLILIGAGFVVEGLFPYFGAIMMAQVIWGIGYTFVSGAREAWIADEIGEERAGKAYMKGAQWALVGSFIGIAVNMALANINIRLPIILGGILYSCQAIYLYFYMREDNYKPVPVTKRETWAKMKETLGEGLRLVRHSRILMIIVVTGLIFGLFSEGFDRLWTPFMINNFEFPTIGSLKPVTWFGILALMANFLAIITIRLAERKTDTADNQSAAMALLTVNGLLMVSVIGFAISGNFLAAVGFYLLASMFKEARNPFYDAWANHNANSKVKATVLSMCEQSNSLGQIVGGPILGLIGTIISLRVSLLASALFLLPSLWLYYRAGKKTVLKTDVLKE